MLPRSLVARRHLHKDDMDGSDYLYQNGPDGPNQPQPLPQDTGFQRFLQGLFGAVYSSPHTRALQQLHEQGLIDKYSQERAQTPAVMARSRYETGRFNDLTDELPQEAQDRTLARNVNRFNAARFGSDAADAYNLTPDTLKQYNMPFLPRTGPAKDFPPLADILKPAGIGPDGQFDVPGYSGGPEDVEAQAIDRWSGDGGGSGIAHRMDPLTQAMRAWAENFTYWNKRPPTQQEANAQLAKTGFNGKPFGSQRLTDFQYKVEMASQKHGGDLEKGYEDVIAELNQKAVASAKAAADREEKRDARRQNATNLAEYHKLLNKPTTGRFKRTPEQQAELDRLSKDPFIIDYERSKVGSTQQQDDQSQLRGDSATLSRVAPPSIAATTTNATAVAPEKTPQGSGPSAEFKDEADFNANIWNAVTTGNVKIGDVVKVGDQYVRVSADE